MTKFETKSDLSQRGKNILKYVIEDFIETAAPVPSIRLKNKFQINLSTASIRHTLHSLEGVGLLDHLHSSSGRIPTNLGYRFYVDELMEIEPLLENEILHFKRELEEVAFNVEKILQKTADSLSAISYLFGFAFFSLYQNIVLTDLDLVLLSSGKILLILGFQSDNVKSIILELGSEIRSSQLVFTASILRERLLGLSIEEIHQTIGDRLKESEVSKDELVSFLIRNVNSIFITEEQGKVYTSNKDLLLQNPEFNESQFIQSVVSVLDKDEFFIQSLSNELGEMETESLIGQENEEEAIQDCSIVTSKFKLGDLNGRMGIIGPTRMAYRQAYAVITLLTNVLKQV